MSDESERSIGRQIFLRSLNVVRPMGSVATHLSRSMQDRDYPAGAVLYRRGEAATHIRYIVRGDVELSQEGTDPWTLKAPAVVGILDVLQDRAHDRTATAVVDVHALVLRAEDYFDVFEDNFEFARNTLRGVAGNLHGLSLELAPTGGFPEPERDDGPLPARPLNLVERTIALHEAPAFRAASVQGVARLAGVAEEVRYAAGDVLCRRGEPCDALVVVARGLVEVRREDPHMEARFGPGSLVGGYAPLGRDAHEYDAIALAPTAALRVKKEDFFDLLEDHVEVTRGVLAFLALERERILAQRAQRAKEGTLGDHPEAKVFR